MGFVQILEYQTSQIGKLEALAREFREQSANTPGAAKPLRGTIVADTERLGYYLSIVEFESQEVAMEASNRPETKEFFDRMSALMEGPPKFLPPRRCSNLGDGRSLTRGGKGAAGDSPGASQVVLNPMDPD